MRTDIWGTNLNYQHAPVCDWEYHWKTGLDEFECPDTRVAVKRFEVSEYDATIHNVRAMMHGMPETQIRPGKFTKLLMVDESIGCRTCMMSDTISEFRDHLPLFQYVWDDAPDRCKILINGLGLGCALNVLLHMDKVKHITIVEKDPVIAERIGGYYEKLAPGRVRVVNKDAFKFPLDERDHFDAVWHDIWFTISDKNLKQMDKLQEKYEDHADWQGCWSLDHIETAKARGLW